MLFARTFSIVKRLEVGDAEAVGEGEEDGEAEGFGEETAAFMETPLFHTNRFLDLMQVNNFP